MGRRADGDTDDVGDAADGYSDTTIDVADGNALDALGDALTRADGDADGFWFDFAESVVGAAGGGAEHCGGAVKGEWPFLGLSEGDSAVDGDGLAGDVACGGAGEEGGEFADIFGRLFAAEGDAVFYDFEEDFAG